MHAILSGTGRQLLTWTMAGFTYAEEKGRETIVFIERRKDVGVRFIKSRDFLDQLARSFRYQVSECPMFYMKGVVSTELIDRVKSRTGWRGSRRPRPNGRLGAPPICHPATWSHRSRWPCGSIPPA